MDSTQKNNLSNCSRRDFLKTTGMGLAAMSFAGCAGTLMANPSPAVVSDTAQDVIETDVLIIGGGIAGVFAAIKAKEQGVDVTLVDKGTVGKSGLSPWWGAYCRFDPADGSTADEYIKECASVGKNLTIPDYTRMFTEDSMDRFNELLEWGVKEDTKGGRCIIFRDQVVKAGVRLIERTMVTDLLKSGGRVVGAVGFPMEEDKAIVIKAKAVVSCAGSGAFKTPGFPIGSLTHDSDAMAYKAGAEISGKEFIDFHWTHWEDPGDTFSNWESDFGGWHPEKFQYRGGGDDPRGGVFMALQAHQGMVPQTMGPPSGGMMGPPGGESGMQSGRGEGSGMVGGRPSFAPPGCRSTDLAVVGGATAGCSPHKCEGVFPKGKKFSSSVPGFFAAGDSLCTGGANYSGGQGSSSSGSAVQGARAGKYAAEYAKENRLGDVRNSELTNIINGIFQPRTLEKGYSAQWVTQVLQGMMIPYYVLYIKKQDRLEAALTNVNFLKEHFAPNMMATDTHDLRRVHELRNMLLNAEMRLRASLLRTETRGSHYREDYPEIDDKNWLAWIIITKDGDNMKLEKRPVPEVWRS